MIRIIIIVCRHRHNREQAITAFTVACQETGGPAQRVEITQSCTQMKSTHSTVREGQKKSFHLLSLESTHRSEHAGKTIDAMTPAKTLTAWTYKSM